MIRRLAGAILVPALIAACSEAPTESGPLAPGTTFSMMIGSSDRQTGHWEIDLLAFGSPPRAQYSATALRKENGTVSGQFQIHEEGHEGFALRVHGETTCLATLPDGGARAGGTITQVVLWDPSSQRWSKLTELVGSHAVWRVKDSGEGANSAPDLASDIRAGFPAEFNVAGRFCLGELQMPDVSMYPVVRGNVQVETSVASAH